MTPTEHYREAERLMRQAVGWNAYMGTDAMIKLYTQAQVHATLATVPAHEYQPMASATG